MVIGIISCFNKESKSKTKIIQTKNPGLWCQFVVIVEALISICYVCNQKIGGLCKNRIRNFTWEHKDLLDSALVLRQWVGQSWGESLTKKIGATKVAQRHSHKTHTPNTPKETLSHKE